MDGGIFGMIIGLSLIGFGTLVYAIAIWVAVKGRSLIGTLVLLAFSLFGMTTGLYVCSTLPGLGWILYLTPAVGLAIFAVWKGNKSTEKRPKQR